ncbi:hypothetical protein EC396_00685 [Lutibacter sp. HS1-25]|uniref:hypothetical protein n=1 Tax=Lutibacter sp. HS1-25 TaxID=2485000 RepID=UPI00101154C8|nr:hypothetical protein [Lutibacter sp. HS1-25]RXP64524.1 hypothetical protein EC396_00685 [Lutibacter sp. HS1-25]
MQKLLILTIATFFVFSTNLKAQLYDQNVKKIDSTFIYVNGEGTFINFGNKQPSSLNILAAVQSGLQFSSIDDGNNTETSSRISMNLVRLGVTGSFYNDNLTMGIVSDFTGTVGILEAYVGLSFWEKRMKIILGERQTHTNNRLAMADERFSQFLSQSISGSATDGIVYGGLMQNFVGTTREGGIYLETNFSINNFRIYPMLSVTTGNGQGFFDEQNNTDFKYGGRLDLMPLGDFKKNNAYIAHDLYREEKLKLAIGVAGSYNVKANNAMGNGTENVTGIYDKEGNATFADYRKFIVDFMLKRDGFSLVGEYMNGTIKGENLYTNNLATVELTPEEASTKYNVGEAYNVQASYIFKKGFAIDFRYSNISPEFDIEDSIIQNQNWYTFGVNQFIKNNALKVGVNTSYIDYKYETGNTTKWSTNLAVQLIF